MPDLLEVEPELDSDSDADEPDEPFFDDNPTTYNSDEDVMEVDEAPTKGAGRVDHDLSSDSDDDMPISQLDFPGREAGTKLRYENKAGLSQDWELVDHTDGESDPRTSTSFNNRGPPNDPTNNRDRHDDARPFGFRFHPGAFDGDPESADMLCYFDNMMPSPMKWLRRTEARRRYLAPDQEPITKAELDTFYGLTFAMTLQPLPSVKDYWATTGSFPFPAPNFNRFMVRDRFLLIRRCYTFDNDPKPSADLDENAPMVGVIGNEDVQVKGGKRGNNGTGAQEQRRWSPIQDFIDAFNEGRIELCDPSDILMGDESMVVVTHNGLPWLAYVVRKPHPLGMEIKNLACGKSKVFLRLQVQMGKPAMKTLCEDTFPKMKVTVATTLWLCEPWFETGRICVFDSWFGGFQCADELMSRGLYCVMAVKTGTSRFPVAAFTAKLRTARSARGDALLMKTTSAAANEIYMLGWSDFHLKTYVMTGGVTRDGEPARKKRCVTTLMRQKIAISPVFPRQNAENHLMLGKQPTTRTCIAMFVARTSLATSISRLAMPSTTITACGRTCSG